MKIVVCIKQVPDTTDIKWTENNTIQREGVESIINPFDEYALETALRLKDKYNAKITVISMGPPQAEDILKQAIAMGCNEAYLVSDRKFSGADTIATSRTLSKAVEVAVPDYDLIICGQFAVDGDTGQTGPSIAENLNLPQITYVKEVTGINNKLLIAKKEVEDGIEIIQMQLPGLLCVQKCDYDPRRALISGYIKAQNTQIPVLNLEDIKLEAEQVGMKGSPTYVSKAFRPEQRKEGQVANLQNPHDSAAFILEKIQELI